ncbi:hypothetical protein ABFS83_14G114700 [Erythranthe nasuta]
MELIHLKKISLIVFLVFYAAIFSISFAGRACNPRSDDSQLESKKERTTAVQELESWVRPRDDERRLLKMSTNDYGVNNPSPKLVNPRFKQIPN